MTKTRKILFGVPVDDLTASETVAVVDEYIQNQRPAHLLGVNSDKINAIQSDKTLRDIVMKAEIINPDGISMVMASRLLGKPLPERVAGIDLMADLLDLAEQQQYGVYFIGAKQAVIEQAVNNMQQQWPKLHVLGFENGYFDESTWHDKAENLKRLQPKLVFIGISSPQKEYFIQYLLDAGVDSILMGVGGSFDVISGTIKRAPKWMQKSGLEWFYRFMQEPGRMWRRYFVGNFQFILLTLKARFKAND